MSWINTALCLKIKRWSSKIFLLLQEHLSACYGPWIQQTEQFLLQRFVHHLQDAAVTVCLSLCSQLKVLPIKDEPSSAAADSCGPGALRLAAASRRVLTARSRLISSYDRKFRIFSMATMGRPSRGLFWCCWSGGGVDCLKDTESGSNDPTHPSTLSTTVAIFFSHRGGGSDVSMGNSCPLFFFFFNGSQIVGLCWRLLTWQGSAEGRFVQLKDRC